jgi:energy-coupling factor transporter ATP-binding protein EcfA2
MTAKRPEFGPTKLSSESFCHPALDRYRHLPYGERGNAKTAADLLAQADESMIKALKDGRKETQLVSITGTAGSGKTTLSRTIEAHTQHAFGSRCPVVYVPWEEAEDRYQQTKDSLRAQRLSPDALPNLRTTMVPDNKFDLWHIGAVYENLLAKALSLPGPLRVIADRPGTTFVINPDGLALVARPYAPFAETLLEHRQGPMAKVAEPVKVWRTALVPGPYMEVWDDIRNTLKRYYEAGYLKEARYLSELVGLPVPRDLKELGKLQSGASLRTIDTITENTLPLLDLASALSDSLNLPDFVCRYLKEGRGRDITAVDSADFPQVIADIKTVATYLEVPEFDVAFPVIRNLVSAAFLEQQFWHYYETDIVHLAGEVLSDPPPGFPSDSFFRISQADLVFGSPALETSRVGLLTYGSYLDSLHYGPSPVGRFGDSPPTAYIDSLIAYNNPPIDPLLLAQIKHLTHPPRRIDLI